MRAFAISFFLLLAGWFSWTMVASWLVPPAELSTPIDLSQALSDSGGDFATVVPGRRFRFPEDHGEHPKFKTEWWYFTGNLRDASGLEYGYQLTFFRAGLPKPEGKLSQSPWSPSDVMMAHFAVSDPQGSEQFFPFERFARRSLGLSGVQWENENLAVWLEDWRMERDSNGHWTLVAQETLPNGKPLALNLRLREAKPPVLQGQNGYSRKGPKPEHSSYYVSLTRLQTTGTLALGSRNLEVSGLSWFDHEWSSSALAPGLVGWDWFSLQLDDGWDLMLYLLRYEDGRLEPSSSGTLISPEGKTTALNLADFQVEVNSRHRSPRGVNYPSSWTVRIPSQKLDLSLSPRLADQEMNSGVPYWEGAVTVLGQRDTQPVKGSGFVEMTGYKEG